MDLSSEYYEVFGALPGRLRPTTLREAKQRTSDATPSGDACKHTRKTTDPEENELYSEDCGHVLENNFSSTNLRNSNQLRFPCDLHTD